METVNISRNERYAKVSRRIAIALILFHWSLIEVVATLDIRLCDKPLGMESGVIPDHLITASSSYVPNVGPHNGRLKVEKAGGAWCPKQQVEHGVREYLQVAMNAVHVITGVQTQGRYDHGRGQEYAEEYQLEYWRPGLPEWRQYSRWDGKQIFTGNSDTASVREHRLLPAVFATQIRVLPYSVHRRTVCLRVELLGCQDESGIISYSAPESKEHGVELSDNSYDGEIINGQLTNGLGRLVDGQFGGDNFRLDIGYGKGNGWVAWKNDSFPQKYIELLFEFDQVRNFSAVHVFTNNFFSRDVQVFARAKIFFSIGGIHYNGRPLGYAYMPDRALEVARDVTISLHQRLARFVKMRLYFAAKWIMISEVTFDSDTVDFNTTEEIELDCSDEEILVNPEVELSWETFETIQTHNEDDSGYVEVIIGVLTAVMLLLLIVFVIILILSRRQKLQGGSPTLLRNPFGVTINMKDILMNLAPSSNNVPSNVPTPLSADAPSDPSTVSFEQYGTNYAVLKCAGDIDKMDNNVSSPSIIKTLPITTPTKTPPPPLCGGTGTTCITSQNPLSYRSLQNTPIINGNGRIKNSINLGNYFPKVATDPPNRKNYHTAPREKHRQIPPPVVSWNIGPSMGHSYNCREMELNPIPRYCLKDIEKLGSCHAGEISLYETENLKDIIPGVGRLVVVRTTDKVKSDPATGSLESLREVRFLASLTDPNICRVLGIVTAEQPPWTVLEYGEMGDLAHYLQYRVPKNRTIRTSSNLQPLSYSCLIYMATQIASAMRYLESKNVVHKDLAARNCLVSRGYVIKVADIAICSNLYRKDYNDIGGRPPAPIRWMSWESIILDRHTCSSTVWQFAVTLWEILSLCHERPFQHLSNEQVIQNAEYMYYGGELQVLLPKPIMCSTELYQLLCECWKRDENVRPTFRELYMFLKNKNIDYSPTD